MGQRLVIDVEVNGSPIGSVYYQWSAYTNVAMREAVDLFNSFHIANQSEEVSDNDQTRLALIRACERRGGGISGGADSSEWRYIRKKFPSEVFSNNIDRSHGIVALSEHGVRVLHNWGEESLTLDLATGNISDFTVFWSYDDIDEALTVYGLTLEQAMQSRFNLPATFNVSDVDGLLEALHELPGWHWVGDDGKFYALID
jgi:hypothetical protein